MGRKVDPALIVAEALALARAERELAELEARLERSKSEALRTWEDEHMDEIKLAGELAFKVARYRQSMQRIIDALDAEVEHG